MDAPDPGRWRRRALSISLCVLLTAVMLVSLPFALPLALARDLVMRRRLAWARSLLLIAWVLICECWGLLAMSATWWISLVRGRAWLASATAALQRTWTSALLRGVLRLFSMKLEVEGQAAVATAPFVLLGRHASTADVLLPMQAVSVPHGYDAHYVLKRELRWDPCLDVAGSRFANVFVRRGDGEAEIERVGGLTDHLSPHSMIVLFPEGTRFSPRRLERRITELRERDDPQLELALQLRRSLPPHLGGLRALLERAPGVDVVFLTHVGLEGVRTIADVFGGALIERTIRVKLWRVARAEIPDAKLRRWLFEQWLEVDAFGGSPTTQDR